MSDSGIRLGAKVLIHRFDNQPELQRQKVKRDVGCDLINAILELGGECRVSLLQLEKPREGDDDMIIRYVLDVWVEPNFRRKWRKE